MKVKLKNNWFAPGAEMSKGTRVYSGQRFKAGEHVMADDLYEVLPKSATVIEPPKEVKLKEEAPTEEEVAEVFGPREPVQKKKLVPGKFKNK